jgi:hypothetical protein
VKDQFNAKIKLIIALVITAIVMVYSIELGIRLFTGGSGRIEYLVVALIIIALMLVVDVLLYGN